MRNHVLFQMWGPFRNSLIESHLFYLEQARKRLFVQFENLEAEANRAAEQWLEKRGKSFDPERDDPGDLYNAANDAGIEHYGLLSDMRDQTRLSVVAGMFHEWDKKLRGWLVDEIQRWHRGDQLIKHVWKANFEQIVELLDSLGCNVSNKNYYRALNACRLVVNVYKHGEGASLTELKNSFPEYLENPLEGFGMFNQDYIDHTHLKVSDDQIQEFSNAIVSFWRDVPENIFPSQEIVIPRWFEDGMRKDNANYH